MLKGCIKSSKGPWVVRRSTKNSSTVTKYRFPSERERLTNKQRERRRRSVTRKIFSGLKNHGNYNLPKHADQNDILKALCEEAGWHVDEGGAISREVRKMPSLVAHDDHQQDSGTGDEFCQCDEGVEGNSEPDTTLKL